MAFAFNAKIDRLLGGNMAQEAAVPWVAAKPCCRIMTVPVVDFHHDRLLCKCECSVIKYYRPFPTIEYALCVFTRFFIRVALRKHGACPTSMRQVSSYVEAGCRAGERCAPRCGAARARGGSRGGFQLGPVGRKEGLLEHAFGDSRAGILISFGTGCRGRDF